MKSLMSLLTVGGMLIGAATTFAADKPFYGFKSRAASYQQPRATLGHSQSSYEESFAFQNAPPPAPAAEGSIVPPEPMPEGVSMTLHGDPVAAEGAAIPLFECVEYKNTHEIHPCAKEMIISVKDPCACCDPCNSCCEPKCVNVLVCAPPCGCPEIKCSRNGSRVKYTWGKYDVEVTSRKGVVTVKYDD